MTREITHMMAFTAALESMGKDRFTIGKIAPTAGLVDQYFDDSTGDDNARGPWNEGGSGSTYRLRRFRNSNLKSRGRARRIRPATLADAVGEGGEDEHPEKEKGGERSERLR